MPAKTKCYMRFDIVASKTKTSITEVRNKKSGFLLGVVMWDSGWRQYVYLPNAGIKLSNGCMQDIIKYIDKQMELWRASNSG